MAQVQENSPQPSFWGDVKNFLTSGFGKGILITAALFVACSAIFGAGLGGAGWLSLGRPFAAAGAAQGFKAGITSSLLILATQPIGWLTLAAGGVGGFAYEKRVTVQHAPDPSIERLAVELERERSKQLQPAVQVTQNQTPPQPEAAKETHFCAAENKRRAEINPAAHCKA